MRESDIVASGQLLVSMTSLNVCTRGYNYSCACHVLFGLSQAMTMLRAPFSGMEHLAVALPVSHPAAYIKHNMPRS